MFVHVFHRIFDLFVENLKISVHDARGIHERHIQETDFNVCKVHGQTVYNIFEHVNSHVCRFYRQHVQEREREGITHQHPIHRNRVQHGHCHEDVRNDEMLFDHNCDFSFIVFRYSDTLRTLIHFSVLRHLVEPDHYESENVDFD